jgi:hypothetical protein
MKPVQFYRKLAERSGLKLADVRAGGKHLFLILRNEAGQEFSYLSPAGSKVHPRAQQNALADFRRMARGEYARR